MSDDDEWTATPRHGRARCTCCRCFLASDHDDTVCSPCRRRGWINRRSRALHADRAVATAAFERAGVPGIARALACSSTDAVEVALVCGLLPAVYVRRVDVLAQLVDLRDVPHVVAAERTGLSRWTVATYRRHLGMDAAA
jgi:hypothetical protein